MTKTNHIKPQAATTPNSSLFIYMRYKSYVYFQVLHYVPLGFHNNQTLSQLSFLNTDTEATLQQGIPKNRHIFSAAPKIGVLKGPCTQWEAWSDKQG